MINSVQSCEICGRNNVYEILEIGKNLDITIFYLCDAHVAGGSINENDIESNRTNPIEQYLKSSSSNNTEFGAELKKIERKLLGISCPNCKQDILKFKDNGMSGCKQCYIIFAEYINVICNNFNYLNLETRKDNRQSQQALILKQPKIFTKEDDFSKEMRRLIELIIECKNNISSGHVPDGILAESNKIKASKQDMYEMFKIVCRGE